MQEIKSIVAI